VGQVPFIPTLKENNVRKGFFEHEEFLSLRVALPEHLKPVLTFGYTLGWRFGEIMSLTWKQVDLQEGTVRLEPGETKNDEGRTVYMEPELWEMMKDLHGTRRLGCPYVFHRKGNPLVDFRKSWRTACKSTGLTGRLFHDLRRPPYGTW